MTHSALIDYTTPEDVLAGKQMVTAVSRALLSLSPREERVVRLRMEGERTYDEVGEQFGVTRERIRQIEAKALRLLKHPSRSRLLYTFLPAAKIDCERKYKDPRPWSSLYYPRPSPPPIKHVRQRRPAKPPQQNAHVLAYRDHRQRLQLLKWAESLEREKKRAAETEEIIKRMATEARAHPWVQVGDLLVRQGVYWGSPQKPRKLPKKARESLNV